MATGRWKEQTWSAIHTPALASAGVAYQSRFFEALQSSIQILFGHLSIDLSSATMCLTKEIIGVMQETLKKVEKVLTPVRDHIS